MNVGSHRTHQSKLIQGFQRPPTSTRQTVIPPHGRTSPKTIIRLVSIQAFQGFQRVCATKASRTSNSTHNLYRASRAFVQPRLPRLVTQPTKGFQSICPTKDSRTSNSTQVVTRLPERLFNQISRTNNSIQAKET